MTNGSSVISLTEYNQDEFHLLHAQTVENTMRYFARKLGFAYEEDFWGIVGLLHDLDFEKISGRTLYQIAGDHERTGNR